jgi:hypothetical protein
MSKRFRFSGKRLVGGLRLLAFFSVVSAISLFFALRTARAEGEKRTRELGHKLLTQLGPLVLDEPSTVRINGQRVFISSSLTSLESDEVLNRFEKYCADNSGGLREAFRTLPKHLKGAQVPPELGDPAKWLTLRQGTEQRDLGEVACFARSDATTPAGFADRLTRLLETGDLSELGDMRYVVARRATANTTHVLAIWTEGNFKLLDMFPEHGDARGSDSPNVPRPPASRRLLSAEATGQPYAARIYETQKEPGEILAFYDTDMSKRGYVAEPVWKEHGTDKRLTATPSYARAFSKNGAIIVVSAMPEPVHKEATQVAIAEVGSRGSIEGIAKAALVP